MVDSKFYDARTLLKEGVVFLKGVEIGRMSFFKGDLDRGVYIEFLFVPSKLNSCCRKSRIIVVHFKHINVTTGIHRTLVINMGL